MRARILIVDDDPDIVLALENRITWMGHEPLTAADGNQALRIIQGDQPDLVLLDIQLPGGPSGLEILQQIHDTVGKQASSDKETASLPPVVMLTSSPEPADRARALAHASVRGYLVKPLDDASARSLLELGAP